MTGDKAIICMKHPTEKIFGDRFSSEVKVLEHFIRAPPAKKLDDVGGNIGQRGGHGPSSMAQAGRNF